MASRFFEADKKFIEELRNTSENKNTKRSTDYWTSIFQQWAKTRGKNEQLESYEVPELNEALDNFALYVINDSGNFVKLILNCLRAHAITYTNCIKIKILEHDWPITPSPTTITYFTYSRLKTAPNLAMIPYTFSRKRG